MVLGNDILTVYIENETAKLARQKGFIPRDLKVDGVHYSNGAAYIVQSVLQKWLRVRHNIHVEATMYVTEREGLYAYKYEVKDTDNYKVCVLKTNDNYPSSEQALEDGLVGALKILQDD